MKFHNEVFMQSDHLESAQGMNHKPSMHKALKALILVLSFTLLGTILSAVYSYYMPKKFESRAVIQYKLSTPDKLVQSSPVEIFKIIKDEKTLGAICSALQLESRWNLPKDQCLAILRTMIRANEVRGTDLIDISVRHTNSIDARDIARSAYEAIKSTAATGYEKGLTFELHEEPTIAHYPVSPNVVMNIILGTIVGFFIGIIASILMMIVAK